MRASLAPMRAVAGPSRLTAASILPRCIPSATAAYPVITSPSPRLPSSSSRSSVSSRRAFFSLPDISKLASIVPGAPTQGIGSDGDETRFHASKVLPYTPAQLYELVSDVPAYAGYIPFCTESTVLDGNGRARSNWRPGREPFTVDAELAVGFGGLEERYISRVVGVPFQSVSATASKSSPLFKSLVTTWSFAPVNPASDVGPTTLSIDLAFAFANPLHRIASQAVLPKVADRMVEAFESRAHAVWGRKGGRP